MLCQKCGKKEAVVHVVCMVNNKQIDKWLCADCAEKLMPYAVSGGGRAVDPRNLLETLFLAVSRQNRRNAVLPNGWHPFWKMPCAVRWTVGMTTSVRSICCWRF